MKNEQTQCLLEYNASLPFPHLIVDNFLSDELIRSIEEQFWDFSDPKWDTHGASFINNNAQKKQMYELSGMPLAIQGFYSSCMAKEFLDKMSKLSGQKIEKYSLFGAGMNVYGYNAFLSPHTDFNFNNDIKAYRCLNLLLYLNSEWKESHGGCLQLWSSGSREPTDIAPLSNRLVVFPTNSNTPHGVSRVTSDVQRKSLSLYYYSIEQPPEVNKVPHKTIWKENE